MVRFILAATRSCWAFAQQVADEMGVPLEPKTYRKFADGEIFLQYDQSASGSHVVILASLQPPGDNILEFLQLVNAYRRGNARRITAIILYYGYARSDRKADPHTAIMAECLAKVYGSSGLDYAVVLDPHFVQLQGYFPVPCDIIYARPVLVDVIAKLPGDKCIVSPDRGATNLVGSFADRLNLPQVYGDKRVSKGSPTMLPRLTGAVRGRHVIFVDDIMDTGGTMIKGAVVALRRGAKRITAVAAFGLFSRDACERIMESPIDEVIVTNALVVSDEKQKLLGPKLRIVSLVPLIKDAVWTCIKETSMSKLLG